MGCRILDAGPDGAVLYDSVTMVAFGPVFSSADHAEAFLEFLGEDPRGMAETAVIEKYAEWLQICCDEDGELREPEEGDEC